MIIKCIGKYDVEVIDYEWIMLHHCDGEKWNQRLCRDRNEITSRNGYLHIGELILEIDNAS